jgi:hypothetical protein
MSSFEVRHGSNIRETANSMCLSVLLAGVNHEVDEMFSVFWIREMQDPRVTSENM